jgi:Bacterial TniB protein
MLTKPIDALVRLRDALPPEMTRNFDAMERIKSKFMPTPWQPQLAEAIDKVIANAVQRKNPDLPLTADNRADTKGLAVIGPTRVGKTRAFRQYFDNHPVFAGYRDPASDSPLLWMSAPSPCNIVQLGRRILTATGYPLERELPAHRLFEIARNRLSSMGKGFLYIEELQHGVHNVPIKEQEIVCDALKHLMESEHIVLFVSGIETLLPFIALDSQLDERLVKFYFRKLAPEHQDLLADMVHVYAEAAGLDVAYSDEDDLFARLSHASLNAFGLAVETAVAAIGFGLRNNEKTLTRQHFAAVYAAKTGQDAPNNPFLAERWHEVVCRTHVEGTNAAGPPSPTDRKSKR